MISLALTSLSALGAVSTLFTVWLVVVGFIVWWHQRSRISGAGACPLGSTGDPGVCVCNDPIATYNAGINSCMCPSGFVWNATAGECWCPPGFGGTYV
jgi:hypothetical protein